MDDSKLSFRGVRQHDLAGIQISEIPEEESGEHHPPPTVTTMASVISGPCDFAQGDRGWWSSLIHRVTEVQRDSAG